MTNINISVTPRSLNEVCNQTNTNAVEIEGYYLYDKDTICINLICETFSDAKECDIINDFTRVVTHEFLHKVIYTQTNAVSDEFEEKIVNKISKMR
jgi:hypothetical protein